MKTFIKSAILSTLLALSFNLYAAPVNINTADAKTLAGWSKKVGWETLLNRRGTTWRKLPEKVKDNINEKSALKIMQEQPSIIKRPVLKKGASYLVGFNEASYKKLLG